MRPSPSINPESRAPAAGWDEQTLADPHSQGDKAARVQAMFGAIASSYDLNNRLHSLWMDTLWRRRAAALAQPRTGMDDVVDVACGTGDLAMEFGEHAPRSVIGVDFTPRMIELARVKAGDRAAGKLRARRTTDPAARWTRPDFRAGDAMALDLQDESADIVSIAFGIRNVSDPARALREFYRVLRPAGRVVILEFSLPENPVMRRLYRFYFEHILPRTATLISRDRTGAYRYLPKSVATFIGREAMVGLMRDAGFGEISTTPLTCGVAVCYLGRK